MRVSALLLMMLLCSASQSVASEWQRTKLCEIHQRLGGIEPHEVAECARSIEKYLLAASRTREQRAHNRLEKIRALQDVLNEYNARFDFESFEPLAEEWPMRRSFDAEEDYVSYYSRFMMRYIDVERLGFMGDRRTWSLGGGGMIGALPGQEVARLMPTPDANLSAIFERRDPCTDLILFSKGCRARVYFASQSDPVPNGFLPATIAVEIVPPSAEEIKLSLESIDKNAWE